MKILGSVSDQIVVVHLQVLLKGTCRDELKKVKHVVQYAVFAAYHLSLETSFLADEGASLPKMTLKHSISVPERTTTPDLAISVVPNSFASTSCLEVTDDFKMKKLWVSVRKLRASFPRNF